MENANEEKEMTVTDLQAGCRQIEQEIFQMLSLFALKLPDGVTVEDVKITVVDYHVNGRPDVTIVESVRVHVRM